MLSLTAIPTAVLALSQARVNLARGAEVTKSVATVVTIMLQEAYNIDESTSQFTGYVASIIDIVCIFLEFVFAKLGRLD
jgi:hypothetical protein